MKGWPVSEFCMHLLLFFHESFLVDEKKPLLNNEEGLGHLDLVSEISLK